MKQKILEIQSLRKYYGKKGNITKAVDGISFQVAQGEFIGIMGSSGSGKTTILNCIARASVPTDGKIFLSGEDIGNLNENKLAAYRGKRIGYLFQNFELIDNLTAKENIMLPLLLHNKKGKNKKEPIAEFTHYLDILEIQDIMEKYPFELSGGQKQRVAAARAFIMNPDIILADEPTGALDSKNAKTLMSQLSDFSEYEKVTILMVTHDLNAASYCSRILFIQDGRIFHELRKKIPQESPQEFYTRILAVTAQLGGGSANVL